MVYPMAKRIALNFIYIMYIVEYVKMLISLELPLEFQGVYHCTF